MAYLIEDGKGPYPNKAGEFCGNFHPGTSFGTGLPAHRQKAYLSKMRFGKPSNCSAGTSAEMEARGFVGLYLLKDRELYSWEVPIDTDALTEEQVTVEK